MSNPTIFRVILAGLIAVASLAWDSSYAHVRQRIFNQSSQGSGQESIIHWPSSAQPIRISMHNFSGTLGTGSTSAGSLDVTAVRALMATSIGQWFSNFSITGGSLLVNLTLDTQSSYQPYLVSNNCETTSAGGLDGVNNLLFTSKADPSCTDRLTTSSGVIGLTRSRFQISDGEIVESDIQFDDVEFLFLGGTSNNNLGTSPRQINLRDVITHEFGHFLGLDHSPVRGSTMLFSIADSLRDIDTDDGMGVVSLYNSSQGLQSQTRLKGSVVNTSGTPLFGVAVFAVNARTLEVEASEITNPNGAFEFCYLPPVPMFFYVRSYEPFGASIDEYYSGDNRTVSDSSGCFNPACALMAEGIVHSFDTATPSVGSGGASPKVYFLVAGSEQSFLNLTARTSFPTLTDVSATTPTEETLSLGEPRLARLISGVLPANGSGSALSGGEDRYAFVAPSGGQVKIRVSSFQIFGRMNLDVAVFQSNGTTPVSCTTDATASAALGIDNALTCSGLSSGSRYVISIVANSLNPMVSCLAIPGNDSSCLSSEKVSTNLPIYLLSVYDPTQASAAPPGGFAALSSASLAASTYQTPPSCTSRSESINASSVNRDLACCGTLKPVDGGPSGGKTLLMGWILSPVLWFSLWWSFRFKRRVKTSL